MSDEEEHKELVRQYLRAFNERERDEISELLAEDVVEHSIHEKLHGRDAILDFLESHFDVFPDYSGSTDAIIAEDDMVTVRQTVTGTHTDEYEGVEPTGQKIEWTGIAIYRVEDDEITEIWIEEDRLGLLEQLEVADPPAHLRI